MTGENHQEILLVDDEAQNIRDLFEALKDENYELLVAPNGEIAYDLALKHSPQAIIMDWDMPEMNGIESLRNIRANPEIKNIPVLMATGKMTTAENLRTALEAGANDFIRKPFENIEIIARVKSMINLNQQHRENINLQKEIARQQIASINYQLEMNAQALSATKLRLIQSAEEIAQLINNLDELREHISDAGIRLMTKLISRYKAKTRIVNWNELELLFSRVHLSFYTSLQTGFPDLTMNERKLCALIKLNMTTKEISAITSQNIETIKKNKYRLKKKFGLKVEESLYSFIQEIN